MKRPVHTPSTFGRGLRSSLSNQGGETSTWGEESAALALADALAAGAEPADQLTHGFHTYPARMHPAIAARVLHAFSREGDRVLDPFCGSGTVLIEAMVAGRVATGVDLNPIATRVASVQCALLDEAARSRFVATAGQVVLGSLTRVRAREPIKAPLSAAERAAYEPHVLLELAGLRAEIAKVELEVDRLALEVAFTAL